MTETPTRPNSARPPFVRPDVSPFLAYLNTLPGPRTHEMTPAAARAAEANRVMAQAA